MHADRLLRDAHPAFALDFVDILAQKSIGALLGISSLDNPGGAKHGIVQIDDIECLMGIPREQVKLFLQKSVNEGIIQGCCRTGSSQMVNGEYLPTKLSAVPRYIADLLSLQIEFPKFV